VSASPKKSWPLGSLTDTCAREQSQFTVPNVLEEAPGAYKDIEEVIAAELDLVTPEVKLRPLGVVKG